MVGIATMQPLRASERNAALAEVPELRHVIWYRDPGLRKLYGLAMALCLASATTGYDGYVPTHVEELSLRLTALASDPC